MPSYRILTCFRYGGLSSLLQSQANEKVIILRLHNCICEKCNPMLIRIISGNNNMGNMSAMIIYHSHIINIKIKGLV